MSCTLFIQSAMSIGDASSSVIYGCFCFCLISLCTIRFTIELFAYVPASEWNVLLVILHAAHLLFRFNLVQFDSFLRMIPPFFPNARIELKRHGESPKQQRRPVNHTQLVREVHYPIFTV